VWAALDLLPIGWQSHRRIAPKSCEDFGRRVAAKSQIRIKIKKKIQKTIAAWVNSRKKIKHEVVATKKKTLTMILRIEIKEPTPLGPLKGAEKNRPTRRIGRQEEATSEESSP